MNSSERRKPSQDLVTHNSKGHDVSPMCQALAYKGQSDRLAV